MTTKVFLVGYMGCGKSTLARKLSRRTGVRAVDTDAEVERMEGASVGDIFRYEGEERFREAERRVLDEVIAGASFAVVSTGGGLPTWRDNMPCMNAVGHTVYLRRSPEQIARRLSPYGRRKRPRLQGLDDEQLVAFTGSLEGVGTALDKARDAYDDAYKRLCTGNDNIIRVGERLRRTARLQTKKQHSARTLESAGEDDLPGIPATEAGGGNPVPGAGGKE